MKSAERSRQVAAGRARTQRGSALIEALVAILLFSFGVLGLAGLQGAMLRNQTDAKFRTDALFLANEVIGLAYGDQANLGAYATSPGSICSRAKCADWVAKVGRGLPGGQATIVYNAASGGFAVTLTWTMPDGVHRYVTETAITP